MLLKVLKYDLKFTYKNLIIFYSLSLFFALLGRICGLFDNSGIMLILSKINNGIAVSMLVSVLINNLMRVWARLVLNFYKDSSNSIWYKYNIITYTSIYTNILRIYIYFTNRLHRYNIRS